MKVIIDINAIIWYNTQKKGQTRLYIEKDNLKDLTEGSFKNLFVIKK